MKLSKLSKATQDKSIQAKPAEDNQPHSLLEPSSQENVQNILQVAGLKVSFDFKKVIKGISFDIAKGGIHALVGESGSGKSLTCSAILGLAPENAQVSGRIIFEGDDLLDAKDKILNLRGKRIGYIPQNPMTSLNPVKTIFSQLKETIQIHKPQLSKNEIFDLCQVLLLQVQLKNWEKVLNSYSFELSGGMSQRVMIAMSLIGDPSLLIADEPTTSLDVTIQAEIMHLLLEMIEKKNLSLLLVTHDLGLVAQSCKTMTVLERGEIREKGLVESILQNPQHEYTQALLKGAKFG